MKTTTTEERIKAIKDRIAEFKANEATAARDGRYMDAGRCKDAAYWLQWALDVWEADLKSHA